MITDIEQQTLDLNWFFTNGDVIGHVASGGAKLPSSVARSKENLQKLFLYFNDLSEGSKIKIASGLEKMVGEVTEDYLSSFFAMAEKGLYSYD